VILDYGEGDQAERTDHKMGRILPGVKELDWSAIEASWSALRLLTDPGNTRLGTIVGWQVSRLSPCA